MIIKNYYWLVFTLAIIVLGGILMLPKQPHTNGQQVTIYKSSTCGCCASYISILKSRGYDVNVVETQNMLSVKERFGIDSEMESCHTAIYDNYVVEGHVPLDVVDKLLAERPNIDGIALPDMPAGSPGMPGIKREPFTIYALSNNENSVYMRE